jgi:formamidopyrimidine-DNA glycosylase
MDQEVIAGVGNIVAAESLWRARISPWAPACDLGPEALGALGRAICEVCDYVLEVESGAEVQYINDAGSQGSQNPFMVYMSRQCPRCHAEVARARQSGRSTWFCPVCQPKPEETP